MILRIELLSDLCSGSGDVYNTSVDMDVVYDDYGFPCIPARRLKGCLREACLELVEFGVVSREEYDRIFGWGGNQPSCFCLENAYLRDYEAMVADVRRAGDPILTHPQRVLGLYTYTRTQTAMTQEGTAKENSLRTMRVVKKGLVFEAALHTDAGEREQQILRNAAGMVKHIGMGRTRGLGLVRVEAVPGEESRRDAAGGWALTAGGQDFTADRYRIDYSIRLLAPVLFKSPEGNQARSQRTIEGSKVLGMLAGLMGREAYEELMRGAGEAGSEIIIANACVAREEAGQSGRQIRRCTPVKASLQKKKDQTWEKDRTMAVTDMLLMEETVEEQMTPVGNLFADEDGYVVEVETEINYHHRRPENKATGRADGNGDSAFYQLESIRKGQIFAGYILAGREQAREICNVLSENENARMGQGRTAEYGAVRFKVESVTPLPPVRPAGQEPAEIVHDFVLKLNAPVILYNRYGAVSAEPEELRVYLAQLLAEPGLTLTKSALCFETVGGFNVTWNRRKPVLSVLGSGTVCLFHTDRGVDIGLLKNCFLGERVSEGYGEIQAEKVGDQTVVLRKQEESPAQKDAGKAGDGKYDTDILEQLLREQVKQQMEADARKDAGEDTLVKKVKDNRELDAVIGKMLLLARTEDSAEGMKAELRGIERESKRNLALRLFAPIEKYMRAAGRDFADEKEIYRIYSRAYLNQLKYQFRPGREERRKRNG